MNSNLFHNIANILMVIVAGVTAVLTQIGCTTLPNGDLECTDIVFISPQTAAIIITVLGVLKLVVNVVRDGITGLAKKQPPVE